MESICLTCMWPWEFPKHWQVWPWKQNQTNPTPNEGLLDSSDSDTFACFGVVTSCTLGIRAGSLPVYWGVLLELPPVSQSLPHFPIWGSERHGWLSAQHQDKITHEPTQWYSFQLKRKIKSTVTNPLRYCHKHLPLSTGGLRGWNLSQRFWPSPFSVGVRSSQEFARKCLRLQQGPSQELILQLKDDATCHATTQNRLEDRVLTEIATRVQMRVVRGVTEGTTVCSSCCTTPPVIEALGILLGSRSFNSEPIGQAGFVTLLSMAEGILLTKPVWK